MEPLYLSKQPPRPCREALDGIAFLPRAVDKARASLAGGSLGDYFVTRDDVRTLSGLFFRRLGISEADFTEWVASAAAEAGVAAKVRTVADQATIDAWNVLLANIRVADVDPHTRGFLERAYGTGLDIEPDELLIDVIERDDARSFA